MIKFFRRIRQRLLTENKFSKYLLYAIGEVLLVIIGILIALQINNSNTLRKETQELHGYLENIQNNIASDKVQIESIITFRDSTRVYSRKFLSLSQLDEITFSHSSQIFHARYNIFYDRYLEINPSGFEALKNSGFLGKIQSTKIETLINDYYLLVNSVANHEKSLNDFIENMEVFGFEENVFGKLINAFMRSDSEHYLQEHQDEIKTLINHPSLQGAHFRGTLLEGLSGSYKELISLGEQITIEIENIVNN